MLHNVSPNVSQLTWIQPGKASLSPTTLQQLPSALQAGDIVLVASLWLAPSGALYASMHHYILVRQARFRVFTQPNAIVSQQLMHATNNKLTISEIMIPNTPVGQASILAFPTHYNRSHHCQGGPIDRSIPSKSWPCWRGRHSKVD